MTTPAQTIIELAASVGATLSTAESCTGGLIAAALTDIPGSSNVLDRGYVTYSNDAKMEMIDVRRETLEEHGAVSVQVAQEMAEGALRNAHTTLAVSVTGIAGPGGSEFKPEGRVCFGLAQTGRPTVVELIDFGALGRDNVRKATRDHALEMIISRLQEHTRSL